MKIKRIKQTLRSIPTTTTRELLKKQRRKEEKRKEMEEISEKNLKFSLQKLFSFCFSLPLFFHFFLRLCTKKLFDREFAKKSKRETKKQKRKRQVTKELKQKEPKKRKR